MERGVLLNMRKEGLENGCAEIWEYFVCHSEIIRGRK